MFAQFQDLVCFKYPLLVPWNHVFIYFIGINIRHKHGKLINKAVFFNSWKTYQHITQPTAYKQVLLSFCIIITMWLQYNTIEIIPALIHVFLRLNIRFIVSWVLLSSTYWSSEVRRTAVQRRIYKRRPHGLYRHTSWLTVIENPNITLKGNVAKVIK